jgi:hypothetical protein
MGMLTLEVSVVVLHIVLRFTRTRLPGLVDPPIVDLKLRDVYLFQ